MKGIVFLRVALLVIGMFPFPSPAINMGRLSAVNDKVANRLLSQKVVGKNWEDVPFLVGEIPLGKKFLEKAETSIGEGYTSITHGDYAGYAQASLDLFQTLPQSETELREKFLRTTDEPLSFARFAIRATPENSPPKDNWWVAGGYGTRYWIDDLFTMPTWLGMLGSKQNGLPGNKEARDLAFEMISNYVSILWDPNTNLFWHDASSVNQNAYWGRGNGWAAYGLVRTAGYLDTPYGGNYKRVLEQNDIRALLNKMFESLVLRRTPDGGWPSDLSNPTCTKAETSATGLITFALERGIREGWVNHETYLPIVEEALKLLLSKVNEDGDISDIQPPGTGADCYVVTSNDEGVNVNYGVGAFLLATREALYLDFTRFDPQREIPNP